MVIFALGTADDLAVPLRREQVIAQHRSRIGRILLHVERLRFLRVVMDEDGAIIVGREQRLIFGTKVRAPCDRRAFLAQTFHRVGVADSREG
jgi:hypothetical protein